MILWKRYTQYASKFGKLSSGHNTGKLVFIPIPKKGNAKERWNYCTIALISHSSKVMLKILQARLNCQHPLDHQKSKRIPEKKKSTSGLLSMPKPLTVWITKNWKNIQEMGIPDYLTCLLRNLYAGQEATVRTVLGTTDWFQIGKGVRQGCILSPCWFNFYAEYIMGNARRDEA